MTKDELTECQMLREVIRQKDQVIETQTEDELTECQMLREVIRQKDQIIQTQNELILTLQDSRGPSERTDP